MRKLALILVFILMLGSMGCAYGEEAPASFTSGDFKYILLDDGTAKITAFGSDTFTDFSDVSDKLAIPEELDGHSVSSIGDRAFSLLLYVKEIIIPDSITELGVNPFINCVSLTKITVSPEHKTLATIDGVLFDKREKKLICYPCAFSASSYEIPQGIAVIGESAFWDCMPLKEIIIPDSVFSIGDNAFSGCLSLTDINIPESVSEIGSLAFSGCMSIPEIILPEGIKSIASETFYDCRSLRNIAIPEGVTEIGDGAFAYCDSLEKITIPDGVAHIGKGAFRSCISLSEIALPGSVNTLDSSAFSKCPLLSRINVSPDNPTFASIDGVLFDQTKKELICFPSNHASEAYVIPDGVVSIGEYAFMACPSLTSITIPESINKIGDWAFFHCLNLSLTLERNSCAVEYAKQNNIPYTYTDSLDWLNS